MSVAEASDWETLRLEGNKLFQELKFHEALAKYGAAIAANPQSATPVCLGNMAACFLELGEYATCVTTCDQAIAFPVSGKKSDPLTLQKIKDRRDRASKFASVEHNCRSFSGPENPIPLIRSNIRAQFEFLPHSESPATNFYKYVQSPDATVRILLGGSADLRHALHCGKAFHESDNKNKTLEVHVNDLHPNAMARQVFLATYMVRSCDALMHDSSLSEDDLLTLCKMSNCFSIEQLREHPLLLKYTDWAYRMDNMYYFWMLFNLYPHVWNTFEKHIHHLLSFRNAQEIAKAFPGIEMDSYTWIECWKLWNVWYRFRLPCTQALKRVGGIFRTEARQSRLVPNGDRLRLLREFSPRNVYEFFLDTCMVSPQYSFILADEIYSTTSVREDYNQKDREMKGWWVNPTLVDLSVHLPQAVTCSVSGEEFITAYIGESCVRIGLCDFDRMLKGQAMKISNAMSTGTISAHLGSTLLFLKAASEFTSPEQSCKGSKLSSVPLPHFTGVPVPGGLYGHYANGPLHQGGIVEMETTVLACTTIQACYVMHKKRFRLVFKLGGLSSYVAEMKRNTGHKEAFHVIHCNNVPDYGHLLETLVSCSPLSKETIITDIELFPNVFYDVSFMGQGHKPTIKKANKKLLWHFFRCRKFAELSELIGITLTAEALHRAKKNSFVFETMHWNVVPDTAPRADRSRFMEWVVDMLFECLLPSSRFDYPGGNSDTAKGFRVPGCGLGAPFFARLVLHVLSRKRCLPHVLGNFLSDLLEKGVVRSAFLSSIGMESQPYCTPSAFRRIPWTDLSMCLLDLRIAFSQYAPILDMLSTPAARSCFAASSIRKYVCSLESAMPAICSDMVFNIEIPVMGGVICTSGKKEAEEYTKTVVCRSQLLDKLVKSEGRDHLISNSIHKNGTDSYSLWLPEGVYKDLCAKGALLILFRLDAWLPISFPVPLSGFTY
eukprot:ANDGO_02261.mRNA.1 hypothetical protein